MGTSSPIRLVLLAKAVRRPPIHHSPTHYIGFDTALSLTGGKVHSTPIFFNSVTTVKPQMILML